MDLDEAPEAPGEGRYDLDGIAPAVGEHRLERIEGGLELAGRDTPEEAEGVFLPVARDRRLYVLLAQSGTLRKDDGQSGAGRIEGARFVLDELEESFDASLVDRQAELAQLSLDPSRLLALNISKKVFLRSLPMASSSAFSAKKASVTRRRMASAAGAER